MRAVGLEPTRSFEHGHLKPARQPIAPRPRRAHRTWRHTSRALRRLLQGRSRLMSRPRAILATKYGLDVDA